MQKKRFVTRRDFVRQAAFILAALSAGSLRAAGAGWRRIASDESDSTLDEPFDYIVVGSGAGGGPVACNLARAGFRVQKQRSGRGGRAHFIYLGYTSR